jgi:hypothetical protein
MEKMYLGDSVYAAFDGYSVTLTTENGFGPSNTIILEPNTLRALSLFYGRAIKGDADEEGLI